MKRGGPPLTPPSPRLGQIGAVEQMLGAVGQVSPKLNRLN